MPALGYAHELVGYGNRALPLDPDPWAWMAIYLLVAYVCIFAAFGKYHRYVLWGIAGVTTVWMLLCQMERDLFRMTVHGLS